MPGFATPGLNGGMVTYGLIGAIPMVTINSISPVFPTKRSLNVGFTDFTVQWVSTHTGNYQIEYGGTGFGTGLTLASGAVTAAVTNNTVVSTATIPSSTDTQTVDKGVGSSLRIWIYVTAAEAPSATPQIGLAAIELRHGLAPTASTVLLARMFERLGTTAQDFSGNSLNGTANGPAPLLNSLPDLHQFIWRALGSGTNQITFGPSALLALGTTKTIGIRFRTTSSANIAMRLLSKRNDSISSPNGYEVILNPSTKTFTVSHNGVGSLIVALNPITNLAIWHQVVWTTSAGGVQRLYFDGVQVGTNTFAAPAVDNAVPLYLGNVGQGGAFQFDGFYSEVFLANAEFDAIAVSRQYRGQSGIAY